MIDPIRTELKRKAYSEVAKARRRGLLPRQSCEVCATEFGEAHHADYAKPLDITWLCGLHHADEHARLRAIRSHERYLEWCARWDTEHPQAALRLVRDRP